MSRYALLSRKSSPTAEDVDLIRRAAGITVVNETADRAILVEAEEPAVERLRAVLTNWVIAPEVTYPAPGPHRMDVKRPRNTSDKPKG